MRRSVLFVLILALAPLTAARPSHALPPAPAEYAGHVDYVIVTDAALAAPFQPLAAWKTESGLRAVVHTLQAIRVAYPSGRDDAERVRLFLEDAYTAWGTRWVLIGGDAGVMPARRAHTTFFGGADLTSDLYFACLDGDWNADGDTLWGEGNSSSGPGDAADLTPELWVGRAPVRDTSEARRFVNKTIAYAKTPEGDYEERVLMMAEPLPGTDGAQLCEDILPRIVSHPTLQPVRRYTNWSNPAWAPGALPLSRAAALAAMGGGQNLVLSVDSGPDSALGANDGLIGAADAATLPNAERPFHLIGLHSALDAFEGDGLGEAFVRASGGAVSSVGSSALTFSNASRNLILEFFRLVYADSVSAVGEASARSILPTVPFTMFDGVTRWTAQSQLLLGDPELRIWTGALRSLTVFAPTNLDGGQTSFDVVVQVLGQPLNGARVTAWQSGTAWGSALTDGDGLAHVTTQPLAGGSLTLTVTAYDARPERQTIQVSSDVGVGVPRAASFRLGMPAPNPARAGVSVPYALARPAADGEATLRVFDLGGREVRALLRGGALAAAGEVRWDLRDEGGSRVPPGLYVLRLAIAGQVATRRILVAR